MLTDQQKFRSAVDDAQLLLDTLRQEIEPDLRQRNKFDSRDGYPTQSGAEGVSGGGTSDPVGELVLQRIQNPTDRDPVRKALQTVVDKVFEVRRLLDQAVCAANEVKPPVTMDTDSDMWCAVCARVKVFEPTFRRAKKGEGDSSQPRCRWHYDFWREHGFDAPEDLTVARRDGRMITDRIVQKALAGKS